MYIQTLFNITNRFIDKCMQYLEISIVNGLHALVIAIKNEQYHKFKSIQTGLRSFKTNQVVLNL